MRQVQCDRLGCEAKGESGTMYMSVTALKSHSTYSCPGLLSFRGPKGEGGALIDLIVCAHSSATPAAGHTQWANCAWGCQVTAARGCCSQPKYVIADHGHTLENSWEHNVINSDKKERENKERDVLVQKWIVLSVVLSFERNFWKGLRWICANVDMAGAKGCELGSLVYFPQGYVNLILCKILKSKLRFTTVDISQHNKLIWV